VSFAAGVRVLADGAWPVFAFRPRVLVIYWAFRVNYRDAKATEEISVTHSELRVRRVSTAAMWWNGCLNPLWVQLDQKAPCEFGIERLYLVSRGRRVSIASFFWDRTKRQACQSFNAALQAPGAGPTYNPI